MEKVVGILDDVIEMGVAGADKDVIFKLIGDGMEDLTEKETQALEIGLLAASHYMMKNHIRGWYYKRKFLKAIKKAGDK